MYMERYSTSLVIREIQIKVTVSYHFTSVTRAIIKRQGLNAGMNVEKREDLWTIGGIVNFSATTEVLQKHKNKTTSYDPEIPLLG